MKSGFCSILAAALLVSFAVVNSFAGDGPPVWAYGTQPPNAAPAAGGQAQPDTSLKHVTGSTLEFTRAQISDGYGPADWFPNEHPQMPDIVAHGKKPAVRACGLCHYPNGKGRPENAGVSGLPVSYFIQQLVDFKNGDRKSADATKANTKSMIDYAKTMTDEEMKAAAEYFGAIKWTPWIKVVETKSVPKTRIAGGMFVSLQNGESEPLGQRIIEVPANNEATEILKDPHSGFIAYAPIGSIKKGEALATKGMGRTTQCGICHGPGLKGLGPVPGIAGHSPSYMVRQMYDMQQGARKGMWSGLMKPVVSGLTQQDMLNIAAYVASLAP